MNPDQLAEACLQARPRVLTILGRLYPEAAEDIYQEACLRVFAGRSPFRGNSSFSTWFTRIALNCGYMHYRGKNAMCRNEQVTIPLEDIYIHMETPEKAFLQTEGHEDLVELVQELTPRLRQVLLAVAEQEPMKQIAESMNISYVAAKSALFRARAQLRRQLESTGNG